MQSEPTYEEIRDAYAAESADDGWWHYSDYERDVESQRQKFDAWMAEHDRQVRDAARAEIRSTIGAYTEEGVWAFDAAVRTIDAAEQKREES